MPSPNCPVSSRIPLLTPWPSLVRRGLALFAAAAAAHGAFAAFQPYVIRNATVSPFDPPAILANNAYVPGGNEFVIASAGQKAALGSADADGNLLGNIASVAIQRFDDRNRFAPGSGPAVAPYLNFWITDGKGNFAVVANEPSDPAFQPLYSGGYALTWASLANKVAKVYENNDLSWLPTSGSSGLPAQPGRQNPASANLYTFADLAAYIVKAPTPAQLTAGWPGLGSGAPRQLSTNQAWGVNWVFGDTLTNYVSGAQGYVVANPTVTSLAPTTTNVTLKASQAGGLANNLVGVDADSAPGFATGSFAAAATVPGTKSEMYFSSASLFGRSVALGEIARMSYWTKKQANHVVDPRDWYLLIYTENFAGDVSSSTAYGARIGTEPYYAINLADPVNTWNQWTTNAATNRLRFFESTPGAPGANFGSYTDPDWATFLGQPSLGTTVVRRSLAVQNFSVQTGSGWASGFTGQLDGLKIELWNGSVATINFEADDDDAPVAYDATVTPGAVAVTSTNPIVVTGVVDDSLTGASNITSASYTVNGGSSLAMAAADSAFNSPTENVTASFTLASANITQPGVYSVAIRGTDAGGQVSNVDSTLLAVYDPNAGFVTGGGWIDSPPGAFTAPLAWQLRWDQKFTTDTSGWFDSDIAGWEGYGLITALGNGTARVEGVLDTDGKYYGPFSRFDGYHSTWTGTWVAEIDVYLDPGAMAAGNGFDYSVATSGADGNHRRDFIFHVTKDTSTGTLLIGASNNTNFAPREDLELIPHYAVPAAGWYTLQHRFYEASGVLAVDLNVVNSLGQVVFTTTRSDPSDTIPTVVGGNRYAWFAHVTKPGGIVVDNHQRFELGMANPVGKANFGFVSKYKKGANAPDGSTEFVFNAAGMNFHSSTYEWLVVNQAGTNAQFKGTGTINGAGNYGFMIWATDNAKTANPDTFRIHIWDKSNADATVYDNGADQAIGGGNILVQTSKK